MEHPAHEPPQPPAPTWALAVATYERRADLVRCVTLAASQSWPPAEVVVVDASRDLAGNERAVRDVLASVNPELPLIYEKARRPSAAVQRNQASDLASADVVFLIDDDSLLYPEAARRVMEVYHADTGGRIAGVSPKLAPLPPDAAGVDDTGGDTGAVGVGGGVAFTAYGTRHGIAGNLARRLLRSDDLFVPYDSEFPSHPLPEAVARFPVGPRTLMAGMNMTARRHLVVAERFDEDLPDRGPEDSDLSYRLSRDGALVTRFDARIHHVGSPTGRLASSVRSAVDAVAPLMLHAKYSTDTARSRRLSRAMLRRRWAMGVLKDLRSCRLKMPTARGFAEGLRAVEPLLGDGVNREAALAWFEAWKTRTVR